MNMPEELRKQCDARARMISEMQSSGSLATTVNLLTVPVLLVSALSDDAMHSLLRHLKRTRKRTYTFGLNGRLYVLSRADALAIVRAEMDGRTGGGER